MKKFATQAMMLFAASYFLSFIFVSQIALLKCANEDDTRYSCPLVTNTLMDDSEYLFLLAQALSPDVVQAFLRWVCLFSVLADF